MSGYIEFSTDDTALLINIALPGQAVLSKNILLEGKTPKQLLEDIQRQLEYVFVFDGARTLDKVVEDIIVNMNIRNTNLPSISSIKDTAKLYYRIWDKKTKRGLTNNDTDYKRQTVSIVIDMLSWWYVRRLVHVYVVCAILEQVQNTTTSLTNRAVIPDYRYNGFKGYPDTINNEIESLKLKYNTNVSVLQTDKAQLAQDFQKLLQSYKQLETDYQNMHANEFAKDKHIEDLTQKLDEFRELLLHSTSMIFKIEEVPNMVKYG
jgi:hypothetical protein